jgi:NAD-dependent deacetylase
MGIEKKIEEAANILSKSRYAVAFTGAGISVESGIPPFRGKNGLWTKYDPKFLELSYYMSHTSESWKMIKKIFYDFIGKAKPNPAHYALAEMEKLKIIREIITQNIDNLHQSAGSNIVHEFHGNLKYFVCVDCFKRSENEKVDLNAEYPNCPNCGSLLKPDFIFFGESIPEPAGSDSFALAQKADVFLVIGTTGDVLPACYIPRQAKTKGATIIEVNTMPSSYTLDITDIYLEGEASKILNSLLDKILLITK